DMGVNLAGVEVVLDLRRRMEEMQELMRQREDEMRRQMQAFVDFVQREMLTRAPETARSSEALMTLRRTPPRR
ncbi:MAG: hypothetical protein ACRD2F_10120, partial [Terriglobales bacterium]